MTDWLSQLKNAKKSCLVDGGYKKIHYNFGDGREMVEEYSIDTNVLNRRAWRARTKLKNDDALWEVEVGEPEPTFHKDTDSIKEMPGQPSISRRTTKNNLEWRIRNLPYPIGTYSVTVEEGCLVVRTTNKKYFKRIKVVDLDRLNLPLDQSSVSFTHKFNTLIIVYKKPAALLDFEKKLWKELEELKPRSEPNCTPS